MLSHPRPTSRPLVKPHILEACGGNGSDRARTTPTLRCAWRGRGMTWLLSASSLRGNLRALLRLWIMLGTLIFSVMRSSEHMPKRTRKQRRKPRRKSRAMRINTRCDSPTPLERTALCSRGTPSPMPQLRMHPPKTSGATKTRSAKRGTSSG